MLTERIEQIKTLASGSHSANSEEMCVMEAVAWVAGEPWSDHPSCACPIISSFLRSWNDGLPSDSERARLLKPLIPKLVGSKRTKAIESKRAWMFLDWSVRVSTPAWLELAGLKDQAEICRRLQTIDSTASAKEAQPDLDAARAAARDAAGAAARDAAGAAARDAARDAARAAAGAAARDAAGAAARDAARAAARDAAGAAARDAAGAAARAAAGDAAGDAARDALDPTVKLLQQSALELIGRMLEVE